MSAEQSKEPVNYSGMPSVSLDDMPPSVSALTINTTKDENVVNVDTITNNNNIATLPPMPTMAPPPTPTTSLSNIIPSLSSADLTLLDNTTTAALAGNNQEKAEQAPLTQEGIPIDDNTKPAAAKIEEEESSSIQTEESQSSSSSSDDEDSSSEESSEESSDEEESSSDSSEDPSIDKSDKILNTTNTIEDEEEEVSIHMRKAPPEAKLSPRLSTTATKKVLQQLQHPPSIPQNPFTISPLGEISSNGIIGSPNSVQSSSGKSEELMEGVLTTSQVLYDNEDDYNEDLEIGGGRREGRGLNMEAQQGAAFYAAYTNRKTVPNNYFKNISHSSSQRNFQQVRRQSRRSSKIGQDLYS